MHGQRLHVGAPLSGSPFETHVGRLKRVRKTNLANPPKAIKELFLSRWNETCFFGVADHFGQRLAELIERLMLNLADAFF